MSKRRIVLIFVLAGLSLTGIILVQAFWIRNALQVKEAQLDASVTEALTALTRKIEKRNVALLAANLEADSLSIPKYLVSSTTDASQIASPTVKIRRTFPPVSHISYSTSQQPRSKRAHRVKRSSHDRIVVFTDSIVSPEQIRVEEAVDDFNVDSVEAVVASQLERSFEEMNITIVDSDEKPVHRQMRWNFGKIPRKRESKSVVVYTTNNGSSGDSKWVELVQSAYKKRVNVLRQIAVEADASRLPLDKRIDFKGLDSMLLAELQSKGVVGNVSFGVYSGNPQKAIYKANGYDSLYMGRVYKTGLFPGNIIPLTDTIKVYLPNRRQQIYSSAVVPGIASLVFTLIMILTFYLTIKTILNQKKLAEMKADFINNMTHELKTPIATIRLAVDSIDNPKTLVNPENITYFTKAIRDENFRMNRMVEEVLQAAKLDRREVRLSPTSLDFQDLVAVVVSKMAIIASDRGGVIQFEPTETEFYMVGDANHLESMVFNLLDNAIKYSKTAPIVTVRLSKMPDIIVLTIEDHGIGITKEDQHRIFEKFFRVSHGNVHDVKGFGLGLSYVKEIVTLHGGTIKLKSEPGAGSTFTVFLPFKRG